MKNDITLSEALKIINHEDVNGEAYPFDIAVRTLNRNSKAGGKLNSYKGAKLLKRPAAKQPSNKLLDNVLVADKATKNPNHWKQRTRNLQLANGDIKKIHIRLIVSINNQNVVY